MPLSEIDGMLERLLCVEPVERRFSRLVLAFSSSSMARRKSTFEPIRDASSPVVWNCAALRSADVGWASASGDFILGEPRVLKEFGCTLEGAADWAVLCAATARSFGKNGGAGGLHGRRRANWFEVCLRL